MTCGVPILRHYGLPAMSSASRRPLVTPALTIAEYLGHHRRRHRRTIAGRSMVNTRTTADCGLDAAGVTERVHRSSGYRAALPGSRRTSYAIVVTVLPKWSRPYDLRVCSMFARMSPVRAGRNRHCPVLFPACQWRIFAGTDVKAQVAAWDPGTQQRTLNPRVRGSSPWRRTRSDLGFYRSRPRPTGNCRSSAWYQDPSRRPARIKAHPREAATAAPRVWPHGLFHRGFVQRVGQQFRRGEHYLVVAVDLGHSGAGQPAGHSRVPVGGPGRQR